MHNKFKSKLATVMNWCVSMYAYITALILLIYMISTLSMAMWNFFMEFDHVVGTVTDMDPGNHHERHAIEALILHFVAYTIVLIKAYTILMSYARKHHINIKYLVEIAIIAPAVEILFNSSAYSIEVLYLLGAFGISNLLIYAIWYRNFKEIGDDDND